MTVAFRRYCSLPCIAATRSGHDCGRNGGGLWLDIADALADGRQPLCWQHHDAFETQLQRIALGIDAPIDIPDRRSLYLGSGVALPSDGCRAVTDVDLRRCGAATMKVASLVGHIVLPLCKHHAASLTGRFRIEWDEQASAPWGWQLARDYGVAV